MKKIFDLLLLSAFLIIGGCSKGGFKTSETGLKYKFIVSNPDNIQPTVGDVVAIKMKYCSADGKVLDEYPLFRTQLKKPSHEGGCIEDGLAMMHKGDSAVFLIKAEDYYTFTLKQKLPKDIDPTSNLVFNIRMIEVTPYGDFTRERQAARMSGEKEEKQLLNDYLKRTNVTTAPTTSGLIYIETQKGKGSAPVTGKNVTVHYLGYFIDGQIFDSSYDRKEPFTFKLGAGEVIPGWDEGIAKMQVGGKARLIIPSNLAYGDRQTGLVPPFATLIFDVELLDAEQ
jgi:FKBP-type peptidyl-prolyl cis-trans isomerase FkpA